MFYKESALLIRITIVFFIVQAVFTAIWHDVTTTVQETVENIDIYESKCDKSQFFTTIPSVFLK